MTHRPNARKYVRWAGGVPLAVVFVCAAAFGGASAQTPARLDRNTRTDIGSALRVIRPLIRDDPARAISMLRRLSREYPSYSRIYVLLGETYEAANQPDSARVAYEQCLRIDPENTQAGAALGTLYVGQERRDDAEAVFRQLLERTGFSVNTYRAIGSALSRQGFYDLAIEKYEAGRARHGDDYILSLDIAYLEQHMGDYPGALKEYLHILETAPRQQRIARNKILKLLQEHGEDGKLLDIVQRDAARDAPFRREVFAILAVAYLDRGMLESAFDMALRADEKHTSDGRVLFNLAERAVTQYRNELAGDRSRYFDLGLRAVEAYLAGYPQSPHVPRAKLMLVGLLADVASGAKEARATMSVETALLRAMNALDWIITTYPQTQYAEQAYLKKGDLAFRIEKNPARAAEIYRNGSATARFEPVLFAERLARVYIVMDRRDEARAHYKRLLSSNSAELRETGIYYSGLLLGFSHEYESARDTLTALAKKDPASPYTNDAIDLAWTIEEGLQGRQETLGRYMDALKAHMAGDTTAAEKQLESIAEMPADTPLRGRALVLLGELYEGQRRHRPALEAFERYTRDYPVDTRLPDVRRKIGRVYEYGIGDLELALATYEDILLSYPHYMFLDEVRKDVVRVRTTLGQ